MNDIWIKRDNYGWSDEQVARLNVECCTWHPRATLKILPSEEHACIKRRDSSKQNSIAT